MARIRIDDLPEASDLTTEQMALILGAGRFRQARLGLESLEAREVPAAGVTASLSTAGYLTIQGTDKADRIEVIRSNDKVVVKAEGQPLRTIAANCITDVAIYGDGGKDVITLTGTIPGNRIQVDGGAGDDVLWGGSRVEWLYGGAGNDILHGGGGNDWLRGGSGKDVFDGGTGMDHYIDATVSEDSYLNINEVLSGAIATKYQQLANQMDPSGRTVQQILGMPKTDEYDVAGVPGGRMNDFEGGDIYWSQATGAHAVYGTIRRHYESLGGPAKYGLPTTDIVNVPGVAGARVSHFSGGSVYWSQSSGTHMVEGAIRERYNQAGGAAQLGLPTSDEQDAPGLSGGRVSVFQKANIYWSSSTGAHVVRGDILARFQTLNNLKDAHGTSLRTIFGLPTSEERDVPGVAGGRMSTFQGGVIYWSRSTGARVIYGAIRTKFDTLGGAKVLGMPITDELSAAGGTRISYFQNGAIVWSASTGAVWVPGKKP